MFIVSRSKAGHRSSIVVSGYNLFSNRSLIKSKVEIFIVLIWYFCNAGINHLSHFAFRVLRNYAYLYVGKLSIVER